MRTYKTFMYPRRFAVVYTCNKCGYTMNCEENEYEEFMTDTIHQFKVGYGYASKRDGENCEFDLCEECLEELYNSFFVPVKVERWMS